MPSEQARSGPRHAAPRKSLLTRLQLPAGKALALAGMPTAVFLGVGLNAKLAQADESPVNPFAPGPCVTQSDEPEKSPEPSPSESESGRPGSEPSPSPSASGNDAESSPSPELRSADKPEDSSSPSPSPSESGTETETKNPLDPLGVGDALKDLFDGPDDPETTEPAPEPTDDSGSAGSESGSGSAEAGSGDSGSGDSGSGDSAAEAERSRTEEAIREAAKEAGAEVKELDKSAEDEAAGDGTEPRADGKKPFPCPTADPEALANAELEPGLPLLPNAPWKLESSKLTLRGLVYHGIVEVKTYGGQVKKVLKFTAKNGVDIKDLHQTVVGPGQKSTHVRSDKGSTSTIRGGTVTMYTEELDGNLFGLIPVTFSPQTPPPLDVPFAVFTDVKVTQAGQFGGDLTVPGLRNTIE